MAGLNFVQKNLFSYGYCPLFCGLKGERGGQTLVHRGQGDLHYNFNLRRGFGSSLVIVKYKKFCLLFFYILLVSQKH